MELLDPVLQSYPWGSRTHLARITGADAPTSKPWAELWFGAHALASATVAGTPLDELIAQDPAAALGYAIDTDNGRLPFLLKLLAADEPLSLQAHPTLAEAQEGFARENAEGIPATAHFRNYRDNNHKPELIVALTTFDALAGFRPVERTKELLATLAVPELDHYMGLLDAADDESALRALFTTWLTLPQDVLDELVEAVAAKCADYSGDDEEFSRVAETTCELARKYPGDPGVLGSMLLNRLRLQPGEAIYLGAGQLHAYLNGMGVEIMANSDNVLRGGLTTKHVDVPELVKVLDFSTLENPRAEAAPSHGGVEFQLPVDSFAVRMHALDDGDTLAVDEDGPAIVLCTAGEVRGADGFVLTQGNGAWVPASEAATEITAAGKSQVFVATV